MRKESIARDIGRSLCAQERPPSEAACSGIEDRSSCVTRDQGCEGSTNGDVIDCDRPEPIGADRIGAGLQPTSLEPADHWRGLGCRAKGRKATKRFRRLSWKSSRKRLGDLAPALCRRSTNNLRSTAVTAAPARLNATTSRRVSNAKLTAAASCAPRWTRSTTVLTSCRPRPFSVIGASVTM